MLDLALPYATGWNYNRIFRENLDVNPGGVEKLVDLAGSICYLRSFRCVVNDRDAEFVVEAMGERVHRFTPADLNTQGLADISDVGLPWLETYDVANSQFSVAMSPVNPLAFNGLQVTVQATSSLLTVRKVEGLIVEVYDQELFRESISDALVPSVLVDVLDTLQSLGWIEDPTKWNARRLAQGNGRNSATAIGRSMINNRRNGE